MKRRKSINIIIVSAAVLLCMHKYPNIENTLGLYTLIGVMPFSISFFRIVKKKFSFFNLPYFHCTIQLKQASKMKKAVHNA